MLWKQRHLEPRLAGRSAGRGGVWPSPGLSELLESAGRLAPARVLDLGPAQETTIQLLTERRLEIQIAALEPDAVGKAPLPTYEPGSFAGIFGWDYLVRTPPSSRERFAQALIRWLAPGGVVLLILPLLSRDGVFSHRFRVHGASQLEYVPQGALDPDGIPSTRNVLVMFEGLECTGARILRHGAREFVLKKPRLAP